MTIVAEKIEKGIGNGIHGGIHNIAYLAMRYDFSQAPDIGDQHGFFEMVGNLRHPALGSGGVGLDNDIGRIEIIPNL